MFSFHKNHLVTHWMSYCHHQEICFIIKEVDKGQMPTSFTVLTISITKK